MDSLSLPSPQRGKAGGGGSCTKRGRAGSAGGGRRASGAGSRRGSCGSAAKRRRRSSLSSDDDASDTEVSSEIEESEEEGQVRVVGAAQAASAAGGGCAVAASSSGSEYDPREDGCPLSDMGGTLAPAVACGWRLRAPRLDAHPRQQRSQLSPAEGVVRSLSAAAAAAERSSLPGFSANNAVQPQSLLALQQQQQQQHFGSAGLDCLLPCMPPAAGRRMSCSGLDAQPSGVCAAPGAQLQGSSAAAAVPGDGAFGELCALDVWLQSEQAQVRRRLGREGGL